MGGTASKTAQSASRKFPTRAPGTAAPPAVRPAAPRATPPQPKAHATPTPKASFAKDDAIRADGFDPDPMESPAFSQRLKQMGVATPNPTLSNSSIASPGPPSSGSSSLGPRYPAVARNQTLNALEARGRLQDQVDIQFENPAAGREFADVNTLRQALMMRKRGISSSDIENRLRLGKGVVAKIESGGVIAPLGL